MTESRAEPTETSALPVEQGQIIASRYRVGPVLGEGGMGVVCAGTHVLLGTPVAIKLIHSDLKDDQESVQRFVNEARATAALKGEHIARVFDAGVLVTGEPYLVMEQLEGVALDVYLQRRGALEVGEAIAIVEQVCDGLAEAHEAGLVHRDIKPGNLFLARRPDGQFSVKILDFGIAKQRVKSESPALTNPGKSLGSPYYMSPEQMLTPASVDERADVWSLGVLLFELLTNQIPFDGESVPQVCANVLATEPPLPSSLRPDLPAVLEAIILRCLEKEPPRRFRTVTDLARALEPFSSAPVRSEALVLEDPEPATVRTPPSFALSGAQSFDSLTPLPTSRDSGSLTGSRSPRRAWPLATALVALASVLFGGWLQYRDPSFIRRAISATRLQLPGDPTLLPAVPDAPLERSSEAPLLLQQLQGARAVAEPERVLEPELAAPRWQWPRHQNEPAGNASWKRLTEERYGF